MEFISPPQSFENKGHYSPGILSNGMLYISGQLPINPDTGMVEPGGLEEQASRALANIERVLQAACLGRENVVQCRVYITDIANWDAFNRIYACFFGAHKPARAVVPVPNLHHGCLVEIEAIAEVRKE